MRDVVVDASAFVKLFLEEPGSDGMDALEAQSRLVAPDYLMIESANVLWKQVRWNGLPSELALEQLDAMDHFDLALIPSEDLLPQALALACELPHPLYDMLYLLLALRGGHPLATADIRMREAAETLGIKVEWVGAEG
jgi:predicted nucleic acid-binding protein